VNALSANNAIPLSLVKKLENFLSQRGDAWMPKLKVLYHHDAAGIREAASRLLYHAIGPSVQTLDMTLISPAPVSNILNRVSAAGNVRSITLLAHPGAAANFFRTSRGLEHVYWRGSLTAELHGTLARYSGLKSLQLQIQVPVSIISSPSRPWFDDLHTLNITAVSRFLGDFLQLPGQPWRLSRLHLHISSFSPEESDLDSFLRILQETLDSASLKFLHLGGPNQYATESTLRPLFCFHELRTVELTNIHGPFDPPLLDAIPQGWPHLERLALDLGLVPGMEELLKIEEEAVVRLFEHCPQLAVVEGVGYPLSRLWKYVRPDFI
jgi:hypothetical protein